jgi:hypothetical protein
LSVAKNTVYLFEAGKRRPTEDVLVVLRGAIDAAGIRLLFDDGGEHAGIMRQEARVTVAGD